MKILSTLIVCVTVASQLYAQSSSDLFQQALRKERAGGDLAGAIALYQKVAAGSDRELAARALVRIGETYERLGRSEALKAYQRVVREFADQKEQLLHARDRLAALQNRNGKSAPARPGALSVSLLASDIDPEGRPTPDGRSFTFTDWENGGNVALRDASTGSTRLITRSPNNLLSDSAVYALTSIVSRDGKRVAYFWTPPNPRFWQPQLRIINMDGSNERVLIANSDHSLEYLDLYDFTPDNEEILALLYRVNASAEMGFVSTRDGSFTPVKQLAQYPQKVSLSPNGKWIAYDFQPDSNAVQRDIAILSSDGRETSRIAHPLTDAAPLWSEDGRYVLFSSARGGSAALYGARVVDGVVTGEPFEVKSEMPRGFQPMGFGGGSLFYVNNAGGGDIFTTAFDQERGRVDGEPAKLIRTYERGNMNSSFLPDGNQVIYMSRRGAVVNASQTTLVVKNLRTGDEKEYARPALHPVLSRPLASPDGRLVATKTQGFDDHQLVLIDLETRVVTRFARVGTDGFASIGNAVLWSRDGRYVYFSARLYDAKDGVDTGAAQRPALMRYDVTNKTTTEVAGFDMSHNPSAMVWNATGDSLTYVSFKAGKAVVSSAPIGGGARREIASTPSTSQATARAGLTYTPDGTRILFGRATPGAVFPIAELVEIVSVPVGGGAVEPTGLKMSHVRMVSFAPDGRLMFTAGAMEKIEIWRIDNLVTRLPR